MKQKRLSLASKWMPFGSTPIESANCVTERAAHFLACHEIESMDPDRYFSTF